MLFAFVATLCFTGSEVFCRAGSSLREERSELKMAVCFAVPSVFFIAIALLFGLKTPGFFAIKSMVEDPFLCVSQLLYGASLFAMYFFYKLLPVTIGAPVDSTSSFFAFVGMFILQGVAKIQQLEYNIMTGVKLLLSVVTVISIAIYAKKCIGLEDVDENKRIAEKSSLFTSGHFVVPGIILALVSALLDGFSEIADAYVVSEYSSLDYFYCESVLFVVLCAPLYFHLSLSERKPYNPFCLREWKKLTAGVCDSVGCLTSLYAYEYSALFSNVILSSFGVLSVIAGRVFLKEKVDKTQIPHLIIVLVSTLLLGVL